MWTSVISLLILFFLHLHYSVSGAKCICVLDLDLCGQYFSWVLSGCSLELVLDVYRIPWAIKKNNNNKIGGFSGIYFIGRHGILQQRKFFV